MPPLRALDRIRAGRPSTAPRAVRPHVPKMIEGLVGQCEHISETDPAVLKVLLKVQARPGRAYERGACGAGRQVPHYAESGG
jgi:hypothetical protein